MYMARRFEDICNKYHFRKSKTITPYFYCHKIMIYHSKLRFTSPHCRVLSSISSPPTCHLSMLYFWKGSLSYMHIGLLCDKGDLRVQCPPLAEGRVVANVVQPPHHTTTVIAEVFHQTLQLPSKHARLFSSP